MKLLFTLIVSLVVIKGEGQSIEKFIINFDFDKYEITALARKKLDSFIHSKPISTIQKIELDGHCDSIGNNVYNDDLSLKRVYATVKYLSKYLPQKIFDTITGFGKQLPLNSNSTDRERLLNRRVELRIYRAGGNIAAGSSDLSPQTQAQTLTEKIRDSTTKPGTNIILKNLNFYGGRHVLLPQSLPILTELLQALQANPTLEIEIQGHICCTVGAEDGLDIETNTYDLSVNRARAIYDHLVGHGIAADRLSYKGFGHRRPLVYPEDTEEKRTTNRRVEIKIVKK